MRSKFEAPFLHHQGNGWDCTERAMKIRSGQGRLTSASCSYGVYSQGVECIKICTYDTASSSPIMEMPPQPESNSPCVLILPPCETSSKTKDALSEREACPE